MNKRLPRGIRNNNPGNIELGDPWQGLAANQNDGRFAQFDTPAHGIRALARTLITYQDKHGINTVRGIINRWAPPFENDTGAYVNAVAKAAGVHPDKPVNIHRVEAMRPIVEAIIKHENGVGNLKTPNTWYRADVIDKGLLMAGVEGVKVKDDDTITAAVSGTLGAAELADVLPGVIGALEGNQGALSSGDVIKVLIGVALVGVAVWLAVDKARKRKQGV